MAWLKSVVLLLLFISIPTLMAAERREHEGEEGEEWPKEREEGGERGIFLLHHLKQVVKTEAGEMSVLKGYRGRGISSPMQIGFINMEPKSLMVPQYVDADLIMFVRRGQMKVGWIHKDEMVEKDLKTGDVYRLPAGTAFYFLNTGQGQRLQLVCSIDTKDSLVGNGIFQSFFIAGGQYPTPVFAGFDQETLITAFNVSADELSTITGRQQGGPIIYVPEGHEPEKNWKNFLQLKESMRRAEQNMVALLRCTLAPVNSPTHSSIRPKPESLYALIEEIVASIENGNYLEALSSEGACLVFGFADAWEFEDSSTCADRFYREVEKSIESFLRNDSESWLSVLESGNDPNRLCRGVLVMCIGVAAFLAFTKCNMTGPVEYFPAFPLQLQGDCKPLCSSVEWDMWARRQLMSSGSDLLGKISHLQYIVYARMLLFKTRDLCSCISGIPSISWWLCRLILFQQRILDERSSSLFDLLQVLMKETSHQFGNLERVTSYWGTKLCQGEASSIVSMAHLEAGIVEHKYGHIDSSRQFLNYAEQACGLQLSVVGVLGFRTVHQVEAKAQMVLVPNSNKQKDSDRSLVITSEVQGNNSVSDKDKMVSHSEEDFKDCDILTAPRLVGNRKDAGLDANIAHNGGTVTMTLDAAQQAVILAQCLLIRKSTRDDELQGWEMAPFIEAVDAQQFSYYIIRCFCEILRIRWEYSRSRTKERALLMMDKLVQGIHEMLPGVGERVRFVYGVYVPTIPALQKEYGELLVGSGRVGDALKIFEDLELWDNLIDCYCLLGKKPAAVDLIKSRLCEMPNDPRLWCSLGDVTNNDANYIKALEVSNNKSARAMRSLARSAYNRGDYETSKKLWESAMALNSLHQDGWFHLGSAALKARDLDKAIDGFTRAVQLDPENGEAWNNIACLHMMRKKSREAFIAFKEALKFRRTSWQLWENYGQVAMDVGNFSQAIDATKMVLQLTNNKRIDVELLERLMVEIEERTSRPMIFATTAIEDPSCANQTSQRSSLGDSTNGLRYSESATARTRETEQLVDCLGNILQQIVRSSASGDIWGLYARLHRIKGDVTMCSEALLKQVRSYQGSDLWHNQDRFKKFAHASLELCKVYMQIASATGSCRELTTAEMHLRNTIKQAESFSETEEYRDLQACLVEVKQRLEAANSENSKSQISS